MPSTAPSRAASSPTRIRLLGDFDLAEEALHDASKQRSNTGRGKVPANPRAWLVSVKPLSIWDSAKRL